MKNRSLVSIDDLTTEEILRILDLAAEFEKQPTQKLLDGKVVDRKSTRLNSSH